MGSANGLTEHEGWSPLAPPGVVALSVMLATFMEVLDSTVVNVSLPHIAGNLSAGVDESTWVLTSYLVSNAIVLPITGWFSSYFGRKRFYMFCVGAFSAASLLCGLAPSLHWLVFFRILQGLGGGALQPISQAILLESFPVRRRGFGMALFGIGVVFAPIIGPTLGGWITDSFSWRWIFFINIPIGFLAMTLTEMFVMDPPYLRRSESGIDYFGLGLLAVGIGALQIVLDKGQREDWFETGWIVQLSILCVVCLTVLVIWELRIRNPVLDLSVFKMTNFAPGTILIFALGIALYGSMVLTPLFLQSLLGYTAMQSGLAMSPGGVGTLIFMPVVGYLVGRRDPRYLIVVGLVLISVSMFMMSHLNLLISFYYAVWPRVVTGIGLAFLFVPISTATMTFMPREKIGNATGIFNLMRNIGGSVGISAVTTMLAKRAQFHQVRLTEATSMGNAAFTKALSSAAYRLSSHSGSTILAKKKALGLIYSQVLRQASAMSFLDCFWLLGMVMLLLIPIVFIMRKVSHGSTTVA